MKFQTSDLSGMMLDFACAQFDSHCEGLTWEFRGDHYVGLGANEIGEPPHVCTIITDAPLDRMLAICREYKLQHQLVYSPSTKWAQGGRIIEGEQLNLIYDGFTWISGKEMVLQRSSPLHPLIAAMRAFVASKAGDTIDLAGGGMNCKPGDLAITFGLMDPRNNGRIVSVICAAGAFFSLPDGTTYPIKPGQGHIWVVESAGSPLILFKGNGEGFKVAVRPICDDNLRPVSGLPDAEDTDTAAPIKTSEPACP